MNEFLISIYSILSMIADYLVKTYEIKMRESGKYEPNKTNRI